MTPFALTTAEEHGMSRGTYVHLGIGVGLCQVVEVQSPTQVWVARIHPCKAWILRFWWWVRRFQFLYP